MSVQSINLASAVLATFNGVAVTKINLNGTQVWVKPSGCISKSSSSPYLISIPSGSIMLNSGALIPAYSPDKRYTVNKTYNLGGIYCGTNYKVDFPTHHVWLYIAGLVYAQVKFYKGTKLLHTSTTMNVTMASHQGAASVSGLIPAGGVDKIVVYAWNRATYVYTCPMGVRAGTIKLWG